MSHACPIVAERKSFYRSAKLVSGVSLEADGYITVRAINDALSP